MDVFEWIEESLHPRICNSDELIYEDMDSQSGRSLPIIYQPFDARDRSHWEDRGSLFDFLYSVGGEGKGLLDFGPGDGWPSLIVAPFAATIVGVDGSQRRVSVCAENARRLGIRNVRFVHVGPGKPLPFEDGTFDGVMASSSVEQTPDPRATVAELLRVLRPGGRLRMAYESLGRYRGGHERDLWLWGIDEGRCRLILFDRDIEHQRVRQYGLTYARSRHELARSLSAQPGMISFAELSIGHLEANASSLIDARVCLATHPSGQTLSKWFLDLGAREVIATHSGSQFAAKLFDAIPEEGRPGDLQGVDRLVEPAAKVACQLSAPLSEDPMITVAR